jgi:hypothetical protein
MGPAAERTGLGAAVARITDGIGRLMSEHLALVRLEATADLRAMGLSLARVAAFLPAVIVGYALLMGAVAYALGTMIGLGWGLAAVGALNLVVGAIGAWIAASELRRPVLAETRSEVRQSAAMLSPSGAAVPPERRLGA